jgi:pimeloyl-ACP methyl ester carboxylesterase
VALLDDPPRPTGATVLPIGPPLPMGRRLHLPGRGTTFIRRVDGPEGAPTLLLLHGWMASGGLNWFRAFDALSEHFNVIAMDMRGHGRGIRNRRRFRLADCADDAAAALEQLGVESVIAVGYSMGGPIAQLLWRRHPDKVDGLVLCATAHRLMPGVREAWVFSTMMAMAAGTTRLGQIATKMPLSRVQRMLPVASAKRPETLRAWASAEMRRHSSRMVMEAGIAMGNYHARWIKHIDVPTAVLITTKDRAIPALVQADMAMAIPGASVHTIEDGHVVCAKMSFARPLVRACLDVAGRVAPAPADD